MKTGSLGKYEYLGPRGMRMGNVKQCVHHML